MVGTHQVEAGEPGVQGHSQIHSEFKACLSYQRPCLKGGKRRDVVVHAINQSRGRWISLSSARYVMRPVTELRT